MGLKPEYIILIDDLDITLNIQDRLIDLIVKDEDGFKADTLTLNVSDPNQDIKMPRIGVKISCLMGYDGILSDMGFFIVDEVSFIGKPHSISISAKGAPFDHSSENFSTLQDIKNRSWAARTLGDLLKNIAAEHKLAPAISKPLENILLPHIDQIAESDMNLLTRQAKHYDAVFKAISGRLILSKRGDGLSISGKDLLPVSLMPHQISSYDYTISRTDEFKSVKASYRDIKSGKDKSVTVGTGKPVKILKEKFPNETTAQSAADGFLKKSKRNGITLEITMPGNSNLRAGSPATLSGFIDPLNQKYIIQKVTHKIDGGGYQTQFTAEDAHV